MNDICYEKLYNILGDFSHYNVNKLSPEDIDAISEILNTYGLWAELASSREDLKEQFIISDCKNQISSLILKLLHSPNILQKFDKLVTSLKNEEGYYEAIIFILIAKV